jgi:hypothetical protein
VATFTLTGAGGRCGDEEHAELSRTATTKLQLIHPSRRLRGLTTQLLPITAERARGFVTTTTAMNGGMLGYRASDGSGADE